MSYDYDKERPRLFTEEGVEMVRSVETLARELLADSGAFVASYSWATLGGDTWLMLAALDYLAERDVVRCVSMAGRRQDWVYVKGDD